MTIRILPPNEAAKQARERVADWKRQREIDSLKEKIETRKKVRETVDEQLIEAIKIHDLNAVKEAIEKGADVNLKNKFSFGVNVEEGTALTYAIIQQVDSENKTWGTRSDLQEIGPLTDRCHEIVELLLTNGADPNTTFTGKPISEVFRWNRGIVELLKKHGATE